MSRKLRKVSIVVGGSYCKQITFDPKLSCPKNNVTDDSSIGEGDSSVDGSTWKQTDDAILRAAVDTVGFDWKRVSNLWFNDNKAEEECYNRATELDISTRKIPNKYGFNCFRKEPVRSTTHLSIRRRRELEALEERRLFGKTRSDFENQLIHRAYLVGHSKLETLLRMNAIEAEGDEIGLTFSSLMVEMQALNKLDVKNSMRNAAKSIPKLPKAISELQDAQVLSPQRYPSNNNHDGSAKNGPVPGEYKTDRRLINLKSTELPIESALMDAIEILTPEKRKGPSHEEEDLAKFISPVMSNPFPCLPITPPKVKFPVAPKTYFMFRSTVASARI